MSDYKLLINGALVAGDATLDVVNPATGKSHMAFDECWYCLACEIDCPKDAITVKIPFLVR